MINKDDILEIKFSEEEIKIIKKFSKELFFNGRSNIFKDNTERIKNGKINQMVGQIGEAALFKFIYGEDGINKYIKSREEKNQNLKNGDSGYDIPDKKIDVKSSFWKNTAKEATDYHLWIREREYYKDWIYILSLTKYENKEWKNYLVGWSNSSSLNKSVDLDGEIRYELDAINLNKMLNL
jgi:hypothetical protein